MFQGIRIPAVTDGDKARAWAKVLRVDVKVENEESYRDQRHACVEAVHAHYNKYDFYGSLHNVDTVIQNAIIKEN